MWMLQHIVNKSPVVALNGYTADIFRRNGVRCAHVAELGIDTGLFRPGTKQTGSVYASSAWAGHPVKGMQFVKEAIRGSGVEVNVITGMPREKVAEALREVDIYVFPSVYEETFGLCLCEAMAAGCACIASDVAGARAQIQDGVTGLLVPPRDAKRLRYYIDMLRDNPGLARSLGEAARAHVEADHSLEAMAARWEAVYESVLANTRELATA
jgi:glycosyltransferase involved in cell wall biosynthesis